MGARGPESGSQRFPWVALSEIEVDAELIAPRLQSSQPSGARPRHDDLASAAQHPHARAAPQRIEHGFEAKFSTDASTRLLLARDRPVGER